MKFIFMSYRFLSSMRASSCGVERLSREVRIRRNSPWKSSPIFESSVFTILIPPLPLPPSPLLPPPLPQPSSLPPLQLVLLSLSLLPELCWVLLTQLLEIALLLWVFLLLLFLLLLLLWPDDKSAEIAALEGDEELDRFIDRVYLREINKDRMDKWVLRQKQKKW